MVNTSMVQAQVTEWGGPQSVRVAQAPVPSPNMGHVVVQVEAAGVNPIDVLTAQGVGPGAVTMRPDVAPVVLGWDIAGTVVATTGDASGFEVGERVFGLVAFPYEGRTFAEYAQVPAWQLAHAPESVPVEQVGAAPLVALTAWQSLFEVGKLREGERVLVHAGAGGVGHLAVQFAVAAGAQVFATASERNREFVESLGASVINYQSQDFRQVIGPSVNLVFDTVGGETFIQSLDVLAPGGRIVTLGGPGNFEVATGRGFVPAWTVVHPDRYQLAKISSLLGEGKVRVHVDKTYPLAEVSAALERVAAGGGRVGVRFYW